MKERFFDALNWGFATNALMNTKSFGDK